ncbi:MAG: carbohydrate deacetylase [Gaiellaceae bacterium]
MGSERILIVNADDFGHSPEVNAGVIEAHERGIVTSASLMVDRPSAREAAAYRGRLALGLHVELGEWRCVEGRWLATGAVGPEAVEGDVRRQLAAFEELAGRAPTHVDSHQHVHRRGPARSAVAALGRELRVPVRHLDPEVRYVGAFYGQTDEGAPLPELVTTAALVKLIRDLTPGTTELGCHPAKGPVRGSSYAAERERELEALCDPLVRSVLERERIDLRSFAELR